MILFFLNSSKHVQGNLEYSEVTSGVYCLQRDQQLSSKGLAIPYPLVQTFQMFLKFQHAVNTVLGKAQDICKGLL